MQPALHHYLPARYARTDIDDLPWIPSTTPGKSSKPLRFFRHDRGFVELLRMESGVVMPLHRHNGETHAFNLSGQRQLCTGEIIGPGDYVYEPPGNVDWWTVVGEEAMVALVVVTGTVDFLGPGDNVRFTASAQTQLDDYRQYCLSQGIKELDLLEG
ncbi:MAG: cupin domain-containing protein [Thermomonas sp.]